MTEVHILIENELAFVRSSLQESIGKSSYSIYSSLLESFLSGKLCKEELEGALRNLLSNDLKNFDLHNKLLGLVLEELTAAETVAISEWQRTKAVDDGEGGGRKYTESASLLLNTIEFTTVDEQLFAEAIKRSISTVPYLEEDEQINQLYQLEFNAAEKSFGRPLLSSISRQLPDESAIRALLSVWLKAFDLEVGSIDEEHILLLQQGLYDYLDSLVERTRLCRGSTVNITRELLDCTARTNGIRIPPL